VGAAAGRRLDCEQIMTVLTQYIIPFFVILVILVVVHELGHYLTAKWFGVKVLEFGIGYPPRLFGRKYGDTEYTFNLLPLGGFVRLLGEEDPSDPRSLAAQKAWKRIVIMAAGSVMNVLLPIVLFAITYMLPQPFYTGVSRVEAVASASPAERAGIQPNDVILTINGRGVENRGDVAYLIRLNQGQTMTWEVRRPPAGSDDPNAGEVRVVEVYARWAPPAEQGPTGIRLANTETRAEDRSYPVWEAIPKGARTTWETLVLARNQIIGWVAARQAPEGLTGPIGIAQATGEVVTEAGWTRLFGLAALLSINLAVLNILPLPMLDGGRIFFVLIEIIRGGRRVNPEKEALVHFIGFVVLIGFVLIISVFDVMRIFRGESLLR
jgi:regulator of sigma E protease